MPLPFRTTTEVSVRSSSGRFGEVGAGVSRFVGRVSRARATVSTSPASTRAAAIEPSPTSASSSRVAIAAKRSARVRQRLA